MAMGGPEVSSQSKGTQDKMPMAELGLSPHIRPFLSPPILLLLFCRYREEPGSARGEKEQCVNNGWVLTAKGSGPTARGSKASCSACAFRGEWEWGQPSKRLAYEAKGRGSCGQLLQLSSGHSSCL